MTNKPLQVGLLLFPQVTQLDLTGPAEVFAASSRCDVHLIWKTLLPVKTGSGWSILPTQTFATSPVLDVICIPGGSGQIDLMDDEQTLNFIRRQAASASVIASVCTGSLVLGAAGLLEGYRATSHWMSLLQLEYLRAIPVKQRVVVDGNRITGAGISAGIDLALTVMERLLGTETVKDIQLGIEYGPEPLYTLTELETSERVERLQHHAEQRQLLRLAATQRAAARLEVR